MSKASMATFIEAYTRVMSSHGVNLPKGHTYDSLAEVMTLALASGNANKDTRSIKDVCKLLGIKHTYKDIERYLNVIHLIGDEV